MHDTIVVVPCFNEEKRLDVDAFVRCLSRNVGLRLVLVNDGSVDRTADVLRDLAASAPAQVHILDLTRNSGKAEAVRQGVLRAVELGSELVGYWDADLSTPLDAVSRFTEMFDDPEVMLVMGSRVRLLGKHVERSALRHYIGRVFATMAARALDLAVYDTQCGAKMFRMTDATRHVFSRPFELNWAFDVEMLARLEGLEQQGHFDVARGCVELALDSWAETGGSKLGLKQAPKVLGELARLHAVVRRARQT